MQSIHVTPSLTKAVRNSKLALASGAVTSKNEFLVTLGEKKQITKVLHNNVILNDYETAGDNWS
ncbi:hypothetical protein D3C75_797320 [compost metagenome]